MRLVLASLLITGCSPGGDVTIDDLVDDQLTNQQDLVGVMQCESVGMTWHHQWAPNFDDEVALALAVEHAPTLDAEGTVSVVRQIGPELWAIGDTDGVARGVVDVGRVV